MYSKVLNITNLYTVVNCEYTEHVKCAMMWEADSGCQGRPQGMERERAWASPTMLPRCSMVADLGQCYKNSPSATQTHPQYGIKHTPD